MKLVLPEDICVHSVFYVNLLESAAMDPLYASHIQPLPPPIEVDGEAKWEMNAIVNLRYYGQAKKLQYRVQ